MVTTCWVHCPHRNNRSVTMRLLLVASLFSCAKLSPPHIVTIVVDDLGWGDVPWNNPESPAVHLGR